MAGRLEFKEKLGDILKEAIAQGGEMQKEEVEKFFAEDGLSEEQIDLVCDYLLSQKVSVYGYQKKSGVVRMAEEPTKLSTEEQAYLVEYRRSIEEIQKKTAKEPMEEKMAYYLPKIVDEALKMHRGNVFLGDMIQEGSLSLVLALSQTEEETKIREKVRAGIDVLLESQDETTRRDHRMVEKVSDLDQAIRDMTEENGRKVAVDEVADKLGITEAEIADILKLAGEEVE